MQNIKVVVPSRMEQNFQRQPGRTGRVWQGQIPFLEPLSYRVKCEGGCLSCPGGPRNVEWNICRHQGEKGSICYRHQAHRGGASHACWFMFSLLGLAWLLSPFHVIFLLLPSGMGYFLYLCHRILAPYKFCLFVLQAYIAES